MRAHRVFSRAFEPPPAEPPCAHLAAVGELPEPGSRACAACVSSGDTWVHLRMCLDCGEVGCCDTSRNRHATAHHAATGHVLIRGIEPGDRWVYCYEHRETLHLD